MWSFRSPTAVGWGSTARDALNCALRVQWIWGGKNYIILPAAGKRTQRFHLIFTEPRAHHKVHPCIQTQSAFFRLQIYWDMTAWQQSRWIAWNGGVTSRVFSLFQEAESCDKLTGIQKETSVQDAVALETHPKFFSLEVESVWLMIGLENHGLYCVFFWPA